MADITVNTAWTWWRRVFLLANTAIPFLLWFAAARHPWLWVCAVLAHGSLLAGMFLPGCPFLGPATNRLPSGVGRKIWLTIDDGPSADTLPLARMLAAKGVRATFFLRGRELAACPEVACQIVECGHTVGNHTYHHPLVWFWIYLPWQVAREIDDCAKVLVEGCASARPPGHVETRPSTGANEPPTPWFRCPAGVKNPFLHSVLRRRGMRLAGWTVRAYDGVRCDIEASLTRLRERLAPGAILLVHEGKSDSAGNPASVEFITRLVEEIQVAGYEFTLPD